MILNNHKRGILCLFLYYLLLCVLFTKFRISGDLKTMLCINIYKVFSKVFKKCALGSLTETVVYD